ncbi:MAG: riboflavin biosynthesis protein RibF [Candidatus Omnitrophica bacterium]|nr:riboflavin biosynthesis protein RibF [Candidatus Omnitrophota bacterium]MCF7877502.1 riboflavin biosynthesis protein RibF [Candidatus Omnitrophota bacterium]MCF7877863.1 riboflavin biosynthesis protein RibF [Candidatus Omnitrophota bacterium]MCF7892555.1 riboflavin biosynthesis protein RibF [Candidatus Omnitrophota bacterium]
MKLIYKKSPSNRLKNCVATIGVFDGVHRGHQYILKKIKNEAEKKGKPSLVISFDTPPEKILYPEKDFDGYITDYKQKASLIESLGINYLWLLETETELLQFSPDDFLSYISKYFKIDKLIVGDDFRFGIKAKAGVKQLRQISGNYGFDLEAVEKKIFEGRIVSSSLVKELIRMAEVKKIKKFLGRDYTLKGKVKRGKGVGKELGFPTANLDTFDYILPPQGVYAAYSKVGKKDFLSAVNINNKDFEVHLINFSGNILDDIVEVVFLKRIRDEIEFQSKDKLAKYIKKDIETITSKYSIPAV